MNSAEPPKGGTPNKRLEAVPVDRLGKPFKVCWRTTLATLARPEVENLLMLILSRKIEQSIIINGDIVVKVLGVDRDTVKLGIDAPEEVVVNREEIQLATQGRPKRRTAA